MNKKAFTLIEVLIVVLIIAILAAIAVPQYQKAVLKSKFTNMYSNLQTLAEAAELYYLFNGRYPQTMTELDINEFSGCTVCGENSIACNDIMLFFHGGHQLMSNGKEYGNSQVYGYVVNTKKFCNWEKMIVAYYQPLLNASKSYSTKMCKAGNETARSLCLSLGGTEKGTGTFNLPD